jgi:hypothetical protein
MSFLGQTVVANNPGDIATNVRYSNDAFAYLINDAVGLRAVGVTGTPAPGLAGIEFGNLNSSNPQLNSIGQTAFISKLLGDPVTAETDDSVWSEAGGGGLRLVAREGTAIAGLGMSETLGPISMAPALDDHGRTAFVARILPQTPGLTDNGLWIDESQAGPRLVIRVGNTIGGHGIDFVDSLRLNNSGEAAFGVRDVPPGGGASIDGLFVEQADQSLRHVVVEGDAVPDAGTGTVFASVNTFSYVFNDLGQMVFNALISGPGVTGSSDQGLWLSDPDAGFQVVMREGMAAPSPAGEPQTFFAFPQSFQLNDAGCVAFMTNLLEAGQIQSARQSIWVHSPAGDLERIVADGDQLTFRTGDHIETREVSGLRLSADSKTIPQPRFFTEAGQIAFLAMFTGGGSGQFVFTPGIPGDYNHDGRVDAADYLVWRKNDGTQAGYDVWRSNFGATGGGGSLSKEITPEPASAVLFILSTAGLTWVFRRCR